MTNIKAPFPWFGGKSRAAQLVWSALGDVYNYVEPFAGSLAVLLARPHNPRIETVNDIDHYIVNFWRAVQSAPDEVAHYANSPVNECDLTARHIWLVNQGAERIARLNGDPHYYDAKVAGWWVWGICCWIGGGWCAGGSGPWTSVDGKLVRVGAGQGVNRKLVNLGKSGRGVNRKRMHVGAARQGVSTGELEIASYMQTLAERLRYVRVCCGDWQRVVTRGAMAHGNKVGIFLDPPYDISVRNGNIYNTDAEHGEVSGAVRDWCIAHQDEERLRIVLAGYEGEHEMPDCWRVVEWKASRAYGRASGKTANSANRKLERLWLSPSCLGHIGDLPLFGGD